MSPLTMSNKVLLALYKLWRRGRKKVKYEDIVVQVFHDFPSDFHLKGYTQYPDSGDAVHKPLYDYRKRGMVTASSKMFALTNRGLEEAERLVQVYAGQQVSPSSSRLGRGAQLEIDRIKNLESFRLFLSGRPDDIIDADLFDYLGVSVRTSKNDFIGRVNTIQEMIDSISANKDPFFEGLRQFHGFMTTRFASEISFKSSSH
jgi:hypothetical protein